MRCVHTMHRATGALAIAAAEDADHREREWQQMQQARFCVHYHTLTDRYSSFKWPGVGPIICAGSRHSYPDCPNTHALIYVKIISQLLCTSRLELVRFCYMYTRIPAWQQYVSWREIRNITYYPIFFFTRTLFLFWRIW